MKIVLGGAQFGKKYGLVEGNKIKKTELSKIYKIALKFNINLIDTSKNYGDSEKVIGKSSLKNLKIITKLDLPSKDININDWLNSQILDSLKNINSDNIYGVLVHNVDDILRKNGKEYLKLLSKLKNKKIIKKIGLSVYSPNDLDKIWSLWKPDIVQIPFNILDQRFLDTGWFKKLKRFKVKIFVRSCFLQGLLISDIKQHKKLKKFCQNIDNFQKWCSVKDINPTKACLHFVKKYKIVDYLVIGFNNAEQLNEIIKLYNQKTLKIPNKFKSSNLSLIEPRRWRNV